MRDRNLSILLNAGDRFLADLEKFRYSLVESDFRCAIYAEIIKEMDDLGMKEYPIRTEYLIGNKKVDIALGENQEVAVELKSGFPFYRVKDAKIHEVMGNLDYYREKGKVPYFMYFDYQVSTKDESSAAERFNPKELGLSGEWKIIPIIENGEKKGVHCFLLASKV